MKFKDILKAVSGFTNSPIGEALSMVPGIGNAVNALDKVVDSIPGINKNSTVADMHTALEALPDEQKAAIMEREIDLQIAQEQGWTERYTAMCAADGQSTRPKIALMMAQVLAFEILAFTVWCFVYPEQMNNPILWTVFGSLTAVPAALLGKYFGELRKEQTNRQSGGQAQNAVAQIIGSFKS